MQLLLGPSDINSNFKAKDTVSAEGRFSSRHNSDGSESTQIQAQKSRRVKLDQNGRMAKITVKGHGQILNVINHPMSSEENVERQETSKVR